MRFPISLPIVRWYWYVLLGLAALLLVLTMPPLSKKVRTVAHLYQSEGLSELAYRARLSYDLLGEKPNIECLEFCPAPFRVPHTQFLVARHLR